VGKVSSLCTTDLRPGIQAEGPHGFRVSPFALGGGHSALPDLHSDCVASVGVAFCQFVGFALLLGANRQVLFCAARSAIRLCGVCWHGVLRACGFCAFAGCKPADAVVKNKKKKKKKEKKRKKNKKKKKKEKKEKKKKKKKEKSPIPNEFCVWQSTHKLH
jgi:hypothetical protein